MFKVFPTVLKGANLMSMVEDYTLESLPPYFKIKPTTSEKALLVTQHGLLRYDISINNLTDEKASNNYSKHDSNLQST